MRKLKLQVQMTVDGFIGGPNGEMDWLTWNWDDGLKQYVTALTNDVDCIVLGRKLAEGFIPHWAANPQLEGASIFNNTKKVVFTKTLSTSPWENTTLAKGDLAEEINRLKNEEGGDIIAYGGAQFVSSLIREDLVNEYHLFINPAAVGKGLSIFGERSSYLQLELKLARAFSCGIVVQHLVPRKA